MKLGDWLASPERFIAVRIAPELNCWTLPSANPTLPPPWCIFCVQPAFNGMTGAAP
jgi:hypothetical protein